MINPENTEFRLDQPSAPIHLNLDTTRKCNLSCWYCHASSGRNYEGPEIGAEKVPEILSTAEKLQLFDINVTGGEPFMWRGLEALSEASHDLDFVSLQIITNATTVSNHTLALLERTKNLKRIIVSIDGLEETHDRNRGEGMYQRTINNLQILKDVVPNITVISVLDQYSQQNWQALTELLMKIGVSQHHLTPVCFTGHAMNEFHGLSETNFAKLKIQFDEMRAQIDPSKFLLIFNDTLINETTSRTMNMHKFVERFKGWLTIIRPDGNVRTNICTWGRTWRFDETLGNINETSLQQILEGYGPIVTNWLLHRFTTKEEVTRKFHIGGDDALIKQDIDEVDAANKNYALSISEREQNQLDDIIIDHLPLFDDETLENFQLTLEANRGKYRFRAESKFAFMFDTITSKVSILTMEEYSKLTEKGDQE
jgi:MoaA/NifB/PqqE/SkfB family radical SAM enzyme